jgi:hypothetical protein
MHMHRCQSGVVVMGKGIDKGLPKAAAGQVGNRHAEHADPQLLFLHKRVQALAEVFNNGQQRASLEMVDAHLCSLEHLKGHFMARDAALQRGLPAEQQQTGVGWHHGTTGALGGETQGQVEFFIAQLQQ